MQYWILIKKKNLISGIEKEKQLDELLVNETRDDLTRINPHPPRPTNLNTLSSCFLDSFKAASIILCISALP